MRDETARQANKRLVTKLQLAFTVETVRWDPCDPCNLFIISLPLFFRCKRSGNLSELKSERKRLKTAKMTE